MRRWLQTTNQAVQAVWCGIRLYAVPDFWSAVDRNLLRHDLRLPTALTFPPAGSKARLTFTVVSMLSIAVGCVATLQWIRLAG
jgi:hypothetical protein